MKKKLTHNLGLKILSVFIAICLWIIAVNINDPVSQRIYTVAVQLVNLNSLTRAGKYVEVLDNTDNIKVTVRASRSVFSDFTDKNIIATADVSKMTEDNRLPIELSYSKTGSKIESIKADKEYVEISIEDVMKLQKRIGVNVVNEPAEGYLLGNRSTDQNAVIISGPESIVSQIASTAVEINVDGATSDVNITLPVHLYDEDGREIDGAKLTMSVNEVFTTVSVLQKKEVPIEYAVKGKAKEGYIFTGEFVKEPATVEIAAKPSVLKNVTEILIKDVVDLSGAEADVTAVVDLKDYLPENCVLANGLAAGSATVTAKVEEEVVRHLDVPLSNIALTNVPQGYTAKLRGLEEMVTVKVAGLASVLSQMDEKEIVGSIDVSQHILHEQENMITEGNYYLSADFALPEYVRQLEDVTVHIVLEEE